MADTLVNFKLKIDKEHPDDWKYFEKVFIHCSHAFNIMVDYFSQLSYIQYNLHEFKKIDDENIEKTLGTDS